MKKSIILTLLVALCCQQVSAQQKKIHYTYDNAGNRIKRVLVVVSQNKPESPTTMTSLYRDEGVEIKQEGNTLKVGISDWNENDNARLSVLDYSGKQWLSELVSSTTSYLDVSRMPNGLYILRLDRNGHTETWKLIKK